MKSGKNKVSPDTQQLFTDFNAILHAIREQLNDKNSDELIQDFIWRTRVQDITSEVTDGVSNVNKNANLPVDQKKAKEDANEGVY